MSEQAILYSGTIGLLGKYCPKSRKKNPHFSHKIECIRLIPFQEQLATQYFRADDLLEGFPLADPDHFL